MTCTKSIRWLLGTLTAAAFAFPAVGAINLELRVDGFLFAPSDVVDVRLFAASDTTEDQSLSAAQIIVGWDPAHLSLSEIITDGFGWSLAGAVPDPYGLNESPLPADGGAILLGVAPPDAPLDAAPAGTQVATLRFTCLSETNLTTVAILDSGGTPEGRTAVYAAGIANLNVLGVRTNASFRIEDCVEDLDGDGSVDLDDLTTLLSNFGTQSGAALEDGDLNGDGDVDLSDLTQLLSAFGLSCHP